ncbi:MAG: hypothetical protein JWR78_3593, partial [Mycobacterium sp.]|nr:hypothetical protein [Mycobacterium sp.]
MGPVGPKEVAPSSGGGRRRTVAVPHDEVTEDSESGIRLGSGAGRLGIAQLGWRI